MTGFELELRLEIRELHKHIESVPVPRDLSVVPLEDLVGYGLLVEEYGWRTADFIGKFGYHPISGEVYR